MRQAEHGVGGKLLRVVALGLAVAVSCAVAAYRASGRLGVVEELETFWRSEAGYAAFSAGGGGATGACPKTFVYDMPDAVVDWAPPADPGTAVAPGVYVRRDAVAENANLLEVILTRLAAKGAACAARDAEDAELFLIPILPKSKHWSEWVAACDQLKRSTFSPAFWRKALPHLDDETARRHFFVFPRVAYRAGKGCENPNFKGSYLGRFPLVSADFWTRDHLSERSRP